MLAGVFCHCELRWRVYMKIICICADISSNKSRYILQLRPLFTVHLMQLNMKINNHYRALRNIFTVSNYTEQGIFVVAD